MKSIQVKQRNPKPFYDFNGTCCDERPEGQEPSAWAKIMDDITGRAVGKEVGGHFAAGRPVVVGHDDKVFLLWPDGREEEINDMNWKRAEDIGKANPAYDPAWPSDSEEEEID